LRSFKYCKVAKELQKGLRIPLKKANATIRGSTFNIDFAEQAMMDYFNTTKGLGKGTLAYTKCLKRARSLIDKKIFCKKLIPIYLVYEKQEHSL
jgi:hypothetical protein